MAQPPGCVYYTISGPEERSKDPLLNCHQISWVTVHLKFTAVNISNTGQLSLARLMPLIATGLVHYVTQEHAKPCKVKWSAFCLLVMLWVNQTQCWWVEWRCVTVWKHIRWQSSLLHRMFWHLMSKCFILSTGPSKVKSWTCWRKERHLSGKDINTCWWGMWEKRQKKSAPTISIMAMDAWISCRQLQIGNTSLSET